jgi:hypothetical protein
MVPAPARATDEGQKIPQEGKTRDIWKGDNGERRGKGRGERWPIVHSRQG